MNPTWRTLQPLLATVFTGWLMISPALGAGTNTSAPHARTSPAWVRSAVVYEIFPRNFSAQGDFNAITERLDELHDLGVDVLWLMPIHPVGQKLKKGSLGSPYSVRDYLAVNPDYGTTNDFKRLVQGAHQRGMKVILDVVAGHTSWDSVLMAHPEFYLKDEQGNIIPPDPDWTDVAGLNYENPELRRYMIDMLKYWMQDYGVDGFRCDVAFKVPVDFWENTRVELAQVNPEVVLLADANASPGLLLNAFDMDNSWPLHYALKRVMSGVSSARLLQQSWENTRQQFPEGALHLRFSDNHQEPRAVALFGVQGALAAQVLMLTLDGVPLFYNGMEVGDATESADPALFEKLPVFWFPSGRPPLRDIYRELIRLRKQYPAFQNDEVVWLTNTAPTDVVSILRKDEKDEFVILVNLTNRRVSGSVELPNAKGFELAALESVSDPTADALPDFRLAGYQWRIYHRTIPGASAR
jgi:glycosidase